METINIDLIPGKVAPMCFASQYDVGREIKFYLFEGGKPFSLDGTETVSFEERKPDGHIVTTDLPITAGTSIILTTTEQMTACKGSALCEFTIKKGDVVIGTMNFYLFVEQCPTEGGLPSASDIENLNRQVQDAVDEYIGDDYYTKAQVDTALEGKADASEVYDKSETYDKTEIDTALSGKADVSTTYTKNEVNTALATKADVAVLNSSNLAPKTAAGSRTSASVTYTSDGNGNIVANGTASSASYYLFYNNQAALPPMFEAGKTYFCDYWSDDIAITINVNAYNSNGVATTVLDTAFPTKFTLPSDTVGLVCRIKISTGHKADNRYITPKFYSAESLEYSRLKRDKNSPPMLSIIYDDGLDEFNTYIMPIIAAKNVQIATAVIPESVGTGTFMDWATIKNCYLNGAEVLTHFLTHTEAEWNTLGTQAISKKFFESLNAIRSNGIFTPLAFVFAGSSSRYTVVRAAAHRIFRAGFNASNGGINKYGETDPYFINRYGTDGKTLAELKGWVDDLIAAQTGWMVWTRHNSNASSEDPTTAAGILSDVIDYALSKGVQIVTVERGLAEYLDMG